MKLKTITLADLEKTDLREQMNKVFEEYKEVKKSYVEYLESNCRNPEELISELYDIIQAAAGALWIIEGDVSMNNEHIEKIEGYVATGRTNNKAREE